jgi:hypothetical protein
MPVERCSAQLGSRLTREGTVQQSGKRSHEFQGQILGLDFHHVPRLLECGARARAEFERDASIFLFLTWWTLDPDGKFRERWHLSRVLPLLVKLSRGEPCPMRGALYIYAKLLLNCLSATAWRTLRKSGFGFRISIFGGWVSGFGLECKVSGSEFQISGS